MRPIAERAFGTVLAAAKVNRSVFLRLISDGGKPAPLVLSITKRLVGTLSASAPVIGFAGFYFHGHRSFLGDLWFRHWSSWVGDLV